MQPIPEQPATILIVDDEPNNLRLMMEQLTNHGLRVLVSQDGESGLRRARYAKPDLVLLDVILPDISGFDLCRQLKADPLTQTIPVIFLTILTIPEDRVNAFAAGGVDYVTKPVLWEELLARITVHLQLQHLIRQLDHREATLSHP